MMKSNAGRADLPGREPTVEDAGQKLKRARERLSLRYRDVEEASLRIAARHKNDEYAIALSRLSDIENKGTIPSIFRIYSLCAIYRLDVTEVFEWYGIDFGQVGTDAVGVEIEKTHTIGFEADNGAQVAVPLSLDPGIDLKRTVFLSRVIQRWGKLPLVLLNAFDVKSHRYGFIGTDDWSMYPLILPGSLVLIDESDRKIATEGWTNEFDRPIYFVETRRGYFCGWCSLAGDHIVMQPHPSSQQSPELFLPDEIDIIGRVDAVAMSLTTRRKRRTRS